MQAVIIYIWGMGIQIWVTKYKQYLNIKNLNEIFWVTEDREKFIINLSALQLS